jgi:hypothetical protein
VGLALVTRIPSLMEAHIAAGALRSAGIAAEVFDAGFGAMEAPVIEGLGGYRLMAPEEEVAAARETLKAIRSGPGLPLAEDDEPPSPWAPQPAPPASRWRSKGMRIVGVLFLAAPLAIWLLLRAIG